MGTQGEASCAVSNFHEEHDSAEKQTKANAECDIRANQISGRCNRLQKRMMFRSSNVMRILLKMPVFYTTWSVAMILSKKGQCWNRKDG